MKDITIADITTGVIDGDGSFDKLMAIAKIHLAEEYKSQRITGDMYTQAYIAMMQAVMAASVQFTIQAADTNSQQELTEEQKQQIIASTRLVNQKIKTEEAQIQDRVTGESTDVTGVVGMQKKVHAAQAKAFKDESFIKAAKQHADAFAVILSNDDAATIPSAFNETGINTMVADMISQVKAS